MDGKSKIYSLRGVSSKKEEVEAAIKKSNVNTAGSKANLFPGAFAKAIANPFHALTAPNSQPGSAPEDLLFLSHADGTGSKSAMAYLYWKETGDISVFKGLATDSIVMNTDDLLCVGVTDNLYFSSTIARNPARIPGEVLATLIEGIDESLSVLKQEGIRCELMGGETADLGDVVKTLSVDMNAVSFLPKKNFIDAARIRPGLTIVGLASAGKTSYENVYNSGIASNGLTSARHDLLCSDYRTRYPETFAETTNLEMVYGGEYRITDPLPETSINVGQALLSPTRTYLPVVRAMLEEYPDAITAILHFTGGGLAKCLKFGSSNAEAKNDGGVHYHFDNLFDFPPVFKLLAGSRWFKDSPAELYEVFNCGQRLGLFIEEMWAEKLIAVARNFNLDAQVIGHTQVANTQGAGKTNNTLTIKHSGQEFFYQG